MVVVKWSDKVEWSIFKIYAPLCGRLYKEKERSLVPLSGAYLDAMMNCSTWYKNDNDRIVPEYHYNEEFKN